jgi:hypothetical protein
MMACYKLLANRAFKLAAPGQQRRQHPGAPRQPGRQNGPFGRGTGGHTGDRVAAPIGGSVRINQGLLGRSKAVNGWRG